MQYKIQMARGARLSDCRNYRYELWRSWEDGEGVVGFVGLNPSTADELEDDATLRRCIGFAQAWGYRKVVLVNLFAFRSRDRSVLSKVRDPVGPLNDETLQRVATEVDVMVAAWGNDGMLFDRSTSVSRLIPGLQALKITKQRQPQHTLYLPGHLTPQSWTGL